MAQKDFKELIADLTEEELKMLYDFMKAMIDEKKKPA